jgi:ABC-2 type transport system ATP-binding protein
MTTTPDNGPAIELVGLTKRFGRDAVAAVDDLCLKIEPGSTFGLIGPNGAGKTTTIKMLMGLLTPTAGTARVLGDFVADKPLIVKQRVGYVPEAHNIDRWMRIDEVVGFCGSLYESWNDQTCREMLELFGLDANKKVKQLSKGMLVKLSLVLAVSHEPEVLVLDEPMAGLDPLAREEFLDGVLRTICERGRTVLFSTHSLDDVQRLADTVGILYGGRLLVHRKIDELLASTKRIRATLSGGGGPPEQSPANTIWQQTRGREWSVTVADFTPQVVQQVEAEEGVENVEVVDIGLEELFKDFIRGQRAVS